MTAKRPVGLSRREFLKIGGGSSLAPLLASPVGAPLSRAYHGTDLAGWDIVVGDGLYAASGESPVTLDDIETVNYGTHSELRANTRKRRIMAHNITFKTIIERTAFEYVHICGVKFRLPYLPSTERFDPNAQTLEGGLFIWDGSGTRLDYGLGFQWMLNPWMNIFGEVRAWTDTNDGQWERIGQLVPDTQWHEISIVVDFSRGTTAMKIDDRRYPSCLAATTKPETWGPETAARFQVEIINLYPEPLDIRATHRAEFKDWSWVWEPQNTCRSFLPFVRR
jgi:hypothetical protein